MILEVFRCDICGETYLSRTRSSECPFCGASEEHLISMKEWKPTEGFELPVPNLSDESVQMLVDAYKLEINNSLFYKKASKATENRLARKFFGRLSKVEEEHASACAKILRVSGKKVDLPEADDKPVEVELEKLLSFFKGREDIAVETYKKFAKEAVEPRLKYFFGTLVVIENTHAATEEHLLSQM